MSQHAINWFEIPAADFSRAVQFYNAILGKNLKVEKFGPDQQDLAVFPAGGETDVSGCVMHAPHMQPSSEGTLVYLNCDTRLDAVLAAVEPAGGKVMLGRTALPPGMGFFAHILDTEGNRVGLHGFV